MARRDPLLCSLRKRAFTSNLWLLSGYNLAAPNSGWWGALNEWLDL